MTNDLWVRKYADFGTVTPTSTLTIGCYIGSQEDKIAS